MNDARTPRLAGLAAWMLLTGGAGLAADAQTTTDSRATTADTAETADETATEGSGEGAEEIELRNREQQVKRAPRDRDRHLEQAAKAQQGR